VVDRKSKNQAGKKNSAREQGTSGTGNSKKRRSQRAGKSRRGQKMDKDKDMDVPNGGQESAAKKRPQRAADKDETSPREREARERKHYVDNILGKPAPATHKPAPPPDIPQFDLAEDIVAEHRKLTSRKRKAPGSRAIRPPMPAPPGHEQIIAEIVSRDIEKLRRGSTSGPQDG
jgi:hypothetical protein